MYNEDDDTRTYDVVLNHEEQYSIWAKGREIPAGWVAVGKSGPKAECLKYIDEVWTDMRPLSLRKHMEAFEAEQSAAALWQGEQVADVAVSAATESSGTETPEDADQPEPA